MVDGGSPTAQMFRNGDMGGENGHMIRIIKKEHVFFYKTCCIKPDRYIEVYQACWFDGEIY